MYIKSAIKKEHPNLVENIEKQFKNDLYKIGDFFKNLSWKDYEKFTKDNKNKAITLLESDYQKLQNSYRKLNIEVLYKNIDNKRNNLAHANSSTPFADIKKDIASLIFQYESLALKKLI